MPWNSKAYNPLQSAVEVKRVPVGAPVANIQRGRTDGYKDEWDVQRAYRDGVSKVVWVRAAIHAIAQNQAKLPIHLHKGDRLDGEVVKDDPLLKILNVQTNQGENAYNFRYRLSFQLLISTRGAFIEVLRDSNRRVVALHLLPPQYTSAVPDVKNFVKGFLVELPKEKPLMLKPEDVIWIRQPHPLDPYLSMTPLEGAGMAIETEMLAKMYNRQFLLNDGRPGGLLVLRSDIDEDDKMELQARFRGNIARTGGVSVISSEDGADFVDTAATPRDAAYIQMREQVKEEILAAFGVPESIIGNASGRTFANAAEEGKVFWMETMGPHLELLARSLSHLSPHHMMRFSTNEIPIMVLAQQEEARFALDEFNAGLISANEYREITGRSKIESELTDALLANPNLTPMGNTEKPTPSPSTGIDQGVPLDAQTSGPTEPVAQFDPNSGQFEELEDDVAGQGTIGIELPASEVPSELTEEEVANTGGPLVKGQSARHRQPNIKQLSGTVGPT